MKNKAWPAVVIFDSISPSLLLASFVRNLGKWVTRGAGGGGAVTVVLLTFDSLETALATVLDVKPTLLVKTER